MSGHLPNGSLPKRVQTCSSCKNHGIPVSKTGHRCQYKDCNCILCRLLRQSQKVMCHQQRFWRHQKMKLDNENEAKQKGAVCKSCKTLNSESAKKHTKCADQDCTCENCNKKQVCDKCRNHNILKPKKNHRCPLKNCDCEYCTLTFKRRKIMKHLQRVRRSGVISEANPEVMAAENLLRQNQSELSFINDNDSPHDDDYIDEGEDSLGEHQDDHGEQPKRQFPSSNSDSFCHKKKARLLLNKSPPLPNATPMATTLNGIEKPRSPPYDLPQLLPFEQNMSVSSPTSQHDEPQSPYEHTSYRDLPSPPQLIPVHSDQEEDEEVSYREMNQEKELQVHPSVYRDRVTRGPPRPYYASAYCSPTNTGPHIYPQGAGVAPQDSACFLPFWNLDLGTRLKAEAILQRNMSMHPFPIMPQPINQRAFHPFSVPTRNFLRPQIRSNSMHEFDKISNYPQSSSIPPTEEIYID